MSENKGNCAISLWLLLISFVLSTINAANINPKVLDSRELISINRPPVNITRSHDGDIIIIKGKEKRKKALGSLNGE